MEPVPGKQRATEDLKYTERGRKFDTQQSDLFDKQSEVCAIFMR